MPFHKGDPKPPGSGRKAGASQRQAGVEAFARSIIEDKEYQENFRKRAKLGELAPALEAMLYHYAYGKPVEAQRDDEQFLVTMIDLMQRYASSPEAQHEIREAIQAYTAGAAPLRAAA